MYQDLVVEIVRLPIPDRLALLELLARSLRTDLAPGAVSLEARLRGIAKLDVSHLNYP